MPEWPEVHTVIEAISDIRVGLIRSPIRAVNVSKHLDQSVKDLVGWQVEAIRQHGKLILLRCRNSDQKLRVVSIHLRMSGLLVPNALLDRVHTMMRKHIHMAIITDHGGVSFIDPRKFGVVEMIRSRAAMQRHMRAVGPDLIAFMALRAAFGLGQLAAAMDETGGLVRSQVTARTKIKDALLDQSILSGIGNIYADEALFRARVRPDRTVGSMTNELIGRVYSAAHSIMLDASERKGSSIQSYRTPDGSLGGAQALHKVYGRGGMQCFRECGTLETTKVAGRTTVFCPTCQK